MASPRRDYSLDNLRTLMVLFILLLHALCAYTVSIPWWHAQDAKAQIFDILLMSIDTFALPVLFFIAGTFACSSFDKQEVAGFLTTKLKRLVLPVVVLSTFYLPSMVYMGYLKRTPDAVGFFEYWLHWMATITDWSYTLIDSMEVGTRYADAYSPHHLWFISLLFLFFLGYAAWRMAIPKATLSLTPWQAMLLTGVCMIAGFAIVNSLVLSWAWVRLGPFILIQPSRIPIYIFIFIFGILMRPHMEKDRPFPGSHWIWLVIFMLALVAMIVLARSFMTAQGPAHLTMAFTHGLLRTVLSIAATCLCINLGKKVLAGPSRWRQSLSASSYDIYLLHMPVTVFIQALLIPIAFVLPLKVLAAFVIPTALFWWLSRFMASRGYALQVGLLAVYFIGFCLFA